MSEAEAHDAESNGAESGAAGISAKAGTGLAGMSARALGRLPVARLRVGGLLVAVAVIMVVFSLRNSSFATSDNLLGLGRAMSTLALVALGETLVIIAGEIDLSIGATYGMTTTLLAVAWINWRTSVYVAILLALAAAALVGTFNALITTYVRVPSFIVTLGSLSIVQGIGLLLSNAQTFNAQYATPPVNARQLSFFTNLSNASLPFNVPAQVLWMVGFALIFAYLLHRSLFGFQLFAIGGNPVAAQLARLPVRRYKLIAFVLSGVMAAVGGILDFSFTGTTQPSAGDSLTFPVFAAVIIGGASLTGGRGTVLGTLLGALLLSVLQNGLTLLGVGSFTQLIFVGSVTIAAVAIDQGARRLQSGAA